MLSPCVGGFVHNVPYIVVYGVLIFWRPRLCHVPPSPKWCTRHILRQASPWALVSVWALNIFHYIGLLPGLWAPYQPPFAISKLIRHRFRNKHVCMIIRYIVHTCISLETCWLSIVLVRFTIIISLATFWHQNLPVLQVLDTYVSS